MPCLRVSRALLEVIQLSMYERTQLLIGEKAIEKLKDSKVAIFGIGGVGSFLQKPWEDAELEILC